MACNIRQILGLLGPSILCCNFIKTLRRGAPHYSMTMALEEAFKAWEDVNTQSQLTSM